MDLCEHSPESFNSLIAEIMSQGYDRETAGRYAVLIGCCPVHDQAGNLLVIDESNQVIATLKPLKDME